MLDAGGLIGGLCWSEWSPRSCRAAYAAGRVHHACMQPRNVPHICFCWRCHVRAERKRTTP